MTMQISLILPQIVALDVVFALAACLQTINVPLIASRRSSYNRKVICAYEASLVLHLMISALILFASSGSYLVAPLDVCARAMGGALWLNAAIFAYGVVLMVRYRRPVMLVELLLVVAVTPPVVFAMGSAWTVVLIAEGAFFLFRSIAALLMDVRNRQEDITAFSTIETINVIPVGILYLDPRGPFAAHEPLHAQKPGGASYAHRPRRYERYMERPAQTQHANARKQPEPCAD